LKRADKVIREQIVDVVKTCYDVEIPVNIAALGILG